MTRARNLSDLLDSNGDVKSGALDNVPASDVVNDTTPQLGGNLDTNGNDVNFGDSDKAIFGAGDDLQIYHDGSNSYIDETISTGVGSLIIRANNLLAQNSLDEPYFQCVTNGTVRLYHNGLTKLTTTSTGVDILGDLTLYAEGSNNLRVDVRQGSAKAWVKATNTATVEDSFNVASSTDVASGNWKYTFTNSMNNNDFATACAAEANTYAIYGCNMFQPATSSVNIKDGYTQAGSGGYVSADLAHNGVVLGDLA